ncbi:DSBA-like thioredoxin domain-containing protein [Tricharina praecox]|uniref:DSBA-like thioredoxin domain-containing protein n=1 Tax=Tricharina praecox TaxID=43433 RepID=UPI00221EEA5E|nr:DSBA-like thioredoxin domain-containing protein [Tricharina praecox]KAI5846866.1 DSBA-like thioredoxin domain-containing protein [Tricharina praecox]
MPTPAPQLTFYFDIISPFAYLAFHRLLHSPLHAYTTYTPSFLSGIMVATSNRPPLTVPLKGAYIFHDLVRQAGRYGIPLLPAGKPANFPVSTLYAMRVLCAVPEGRVVEVAERLFHVFWVQGRGVEREEVVKEVVEQVLGREAWEQVEKRIRTEGKKKLAENTDEAVRKGAFGMPWFVVTDANGKEDVYWGFDHLDEVAACMGLAMESRDGESKL